MISNVSHDYEILSGIAYDAHAKQLADEDLWSCEPITNSFW